MNKNLDNDFNIVISSKSEIKEFDFASYELRLCFSLLKKMEFIFRVSRLQR